MRFALTAVSVALAVMMLCAAAPQPANPSFDVASIKPAANPPGREGGNRSRIETTPTSLTLRNVALTDCVQWAYGLTASQISAPHTSADAYDILAKTGNPATVAELRLMLQNLLAERFKLKVHRESRLVAVYEMVVAKSGPHLPPANASHQIVHSAESLPQVRNGSFLFPDASLPEFAAMLMQLNGVDLSVVDRTGIAGSFDLELKSAPAAARAGDTAALFDLIEAQLGLKLRRAKASLEVLVIDRAEKPGQD